MKKYNETEVRSKLNKESCVRFDGKTVTIENSLGIHSWGMVDFLVNHCGYRSIIRA